MAPPLPAREAIEIRDCVARSQRRIERFRGRRYQWIVSASYNSHMTSLGGGPVIADREALIGARFRRDSPPSCRAYAPNKAGAGTLAGGFSARGGHAPRVRRSHRTRRAERHAQDSCPACSTTRSRSRRSHPADRLTQRDATPPGSMNSRAEGSAPTTHISSEISEPRRPTSPPDFRDIRPIEGLRHLDVYERFDQTVLRADEPGATVAKQNPAIRANQRRNQVVEHRHRLHRISRFRARPERCPQADADLQRADHAR